MDGICKNTTTNKPRHTLWHRHYFNSRFLFIFGLPWFPAMQQAVMSFCLYKYYAKGEMTEIKTDWQKDVSAAVLSLNAGAAEKLCGQRASTSSRPLSNERARRRVQRLSNCDMTPNLRGGVLGELRNTESLSVSRRDNETRQWGEDRRVEPTQCFSAPPQSSDDNK